MTAPRHRPTVGDLADAIAARTGCTDRGIIFIAAARSVRALGDQLGATRHLVDAVLPPPLHAELLAGEQEPQTPEGLYDQVASAAGLRRSVALELVQSVIAEVVQRLGPAARAEVRRGLARAWADLVVDPRPRSIRSAAPPAATMPGTGHTLATGRPGSAHALADGRPPGAHAHSIARADDPHAAFRLSSSRGSRSEQRGDTLADGRPGRYGHGVADAD